jgi:hypothetical protein
MGWTSDAPFAGAAKTGAGGAFDDGGGVGVGLGCPFLASAYSVPPDSKMENPTMNAEYLLRPIMSVLDTRVPSRRSTGQL